MRRMSARLAALVVLAVFSSSAAYAALRPLPLPPAARVPALSVLPAGAPGAPHGGLLLSWCEPSAGDIALRCASWVDGKLGPVSTVTHSSRLLANWADAPGVAVGAAAAGWPWLAHWSEEMEGGDEAASIGLAASVDGGGTWGPALSPHAETSAVERGFATLDAGGGQAARVYWLDARHRVAADAPADPGGGERPGTELRAADLGIGRDAAGVPHLRVLAERVLDPRACDCCPLAAAGGLVFYRDRAGDERRDISVVPSAGGVSRDVSGDGWQIDGCPVNGPSAAMVGRGRTLLVWFTAAAADSPRVRAALVGPDGSLSSAPIDLARGGAVIGRPSVAALDGERAYAGWLERDGASTRWRIVRLDVADGRVRATAVPGLAPANLPHPRGIGRLAVSGGRLYLAWSETAAGEEQGHVAEFVPERPARARRRR